LESAELKKHTADDEVEGEARCSDLSLHG
jgi:hypothetical protein